MANYNLLLIEKDNETSFSLFINLASNDINMFNIDSLNKEEIDSKIKNDNINAILINVDSYTKEEITDLSFYIKKKDFLSRTKVPFICFTNNLTISDELEDFYLTICDDFIVNPFRRHLVMLKRLKIQTERFYLIREAHKASLIDGLTKIANRKSLEQNLTKALSFCTRHQIPLTFMMMDIDKFKNFNDKYGHDVGDDVLRLVAKTLSFEMKRATDGVFRYGGEELSIITTGLNKEQSLALAEKLRKKIEDTYLPTDKFGNLNITISIGCYNIVPNENMDEKFIQKQADNLLYDAKQTGRNKVCIN